MFRLAMIAMICLTPSLKAQTLALKASVRLNKEKGASSGTIIKIKETGKESCDIWVLGTGHTVFRTEPEIEIFYQYDKKLDKPIKAKGDMLLMVENNVDGGVDIGLQVMGKRLDDARLLCAASAIAYTVPGGNAA